MKEITQLVKKYLDEIFSNEFFTGLKEVQPSKPEHWHLFLLNKYSGVAYFENFLNHGVNCAVDAHEDELDRVFMTNLHDEMGICCANGKTNCEEFEAYKHDVWRRKSLAAFGLDLNQPLPHGLLCEAHNRAMLDAVSSDNHLELAGILLFIEIFVVREMRELINAFERTLPGFFPGDTYVPYWSPLHVHEYWYNHRDHDVLHHQAIQKAIGDVLKKSVDPERDKASILMGVKAAYEAKKLFYTPEMLATIGGKE